MNHGQINTILWLRSRLTWNQWRRGGKLELFLGILFTVGSAVLGACSFLAGAVGGTMMLGAAEPRLVLYLWLGLTLGFLCWWGFGVLNELQRSEVLDLSRMLQLPIAAADVFVVNYVASHLSLTLIAFIPGMLGLALGGAFARGPAMLWLVPLALAFVIAVTAWTYWLRGCLAGWLVNPRQRRTAIMVTSLVLLTAAQVPGLLFLKHLRDERVRPKPANRAEAILRAKADKAAMEANFQTAIAAQKFVPLFWLPAGAHALAEGRTGPAIGFTFGCLALAAVGLHLAYRGTVRFYRGETDARAATPLRQRKATGPPDVPDAFRRPRLIERRISGIPDEAAAVAVATMRASLRASDVRMGVVSVMFIALMSFVVALFAPPPELSPAQAIFAPTAMLLVSLGMSATYLLNVFGTDRHGFRAMVLSPMARWQVLLGKNLAWLWFCLPASLLLAAGGCVILRLPASVIAVLLLQWVALVAFAYAAGNTISILAPIRVEIGALKSNKVSTKTALLQLFFLLLFPMALTPVFLAPLAEWWWDGGTAGAWANAAVSALLALAAAMLYWKSLGPLGRLLQRREQRILEVVTAQVE